MGYDLHITRRKDWFDEGDDITKEEFLAYVRSDPEFTHPSRVGADYADWKSPKTGYETWLSWQNGYLQTKNPEAEFVDKLVIIAWALGAKVQGDDGETYLSATETKPAEDVSVSVAREVRDSFWSRLGSGLKEWLGRPVVSETKLPFNVGDKVCDSWGNLHTVIAIDPKAEHGIGIVRTRRDSDGVELGHAMLAHGLTPARKGPPGGTQ